MAITQKKVKNSHGKKLQEISTVNSHDQFPQPKATVNPYVKKPRQIAATNSLGKQPGQIPTIKTPHQTDASNSHGKKPRQRAVANSYDKQPRQITITNICLGVLKMLVSCFVLTYDKQIWTPVKSQVLSTKGMINWLTQLTWYESHICQRKTVKY